MRFNIKLNVNRYLLLDIRMDWETYNIEPNDHKPLDVVVVFGDAFPVKDADGNEVMSGALLLSEGNIPTAREGNETPCSEGTSALLQSVAVSLTPQHNHSCDVTSEVFSWLQCQGPDGCIISHVPLISG